MAQNGYGQLGRGLATGIGSFFGGGNAQARQAGEMAGIQQAALEQQIAGNRVNQALAQSKLDEAKRAAQLASPDAALGRVAQLFGVPGDNVPAVAEWQRTGRLPESAMTPAEALAPGLAGPAAPPSAPSWAAPENLNKIAQAFFADQSTQAGASKSMKDAIEALTLQPKINLTAGVADGTLSPSTGGARFAALEGKPLFNSDSNGAVLDIFGGGLNESSGLARGAIALRAAQAGAQKANAVQSYAAADNSRAHAAQARADIAAGTGTGGAKAPVGYRWGLAGNLEPIPGGPADPATKGAKLAKPPTEGQAKALLFGSRMQIADDTLRDLEQQGFMTPNLAKKAVEGVPLVGGALAMGANLVGSSEEQQVEQAQRDFINAVLRRESGAAIGRDEFQNAAQQYFPQPGDSAAVRRQKAINRQTAVAGMKAEFGEQAEPEFQRIVGGAREARGASAAPAAAARPAAAVQPVRVTSDAEYAALPAGTRFITPDGKTGTKR